MSCVTRIRDVGSCQIGTLTLCFKLVVTVLGEVSAGVEGAVDAQSLLAPNVVEK